MEYIKHPGYPRVFYCLYISAINNLMSYYADRGNKYAQVPDTVVDFHGYTTLECQEVIDALLRERDYKHVRMIVGRGRNSAHGPVLPDFVKSYLRQKGIRFNPSKIQDGGEGSLEVFLW